MDSEKFQKRQSLRVIVSELVMVLAVVATVVALAFIVSGYWLNSDFKIERQGMLQVSSAPTGADFDVDGESSWLRRTNTSKILSSGTHTITLTKEGYDTWTKTVDIAEGLLYRIHYPRLFPLERETEKVLTTGAYTFATFSPDGTKLLLGGDTTEWVLVDLNREVLSPQKVNLANYLLGTQPSETPAISLFTGTVNSARWDQSNSHVLMRISIDGIIEWVLLDTNNFKNSINLTAEFGLNFTQIKTLDGSANELLATFEGNLYRVNLPNKQVSAAIAEHIYDFDYYGNELVYSSLNATGEYAVFVTKINDDEVKALDTFASPTLVNIFKFYDDIYVSALTGDSLTLYSKNNYPEAQVYALTFAPTVSEDGHNGEFITMYTGSQIATLDMEAGKVIEWSAAGDSFGWLDSDIIYSVADGELNVYDFDGFNRRAIAKNVSSRFPAIITDGKWLHYFSDGALIRMQLIVK